MVMDKNIHIFNNFLSKDDLGLAMNLIKSANFESRRETTPYDQNLLASDTMPDELSQLLNKRYAEKYEEIQSFYDFKIMKPKKYHYHVVHRNSAESNPIMGLHHDTYSDSGYAVSAVVYYNDDFEGGEIHFPNQNFTYSPKAGDLIVFLPTEEYAHEVLPVTSGVRYAGPFWFRHSLV
jgi:predicted 2-oxoglutarate/Fe(II)-dependent dioxygenase YbiX